MPIRNNSTGAFTARQVLDQAITGLENLRLLLEEAEALSNCACNGLDSLPSSLRLHRDVPSSYRPAPYQPAATSDADRGEAASRAGAGAAGAGAGAAGAGVGAGADEGEGEGEGEVRSLRDVPAVDVPADVPAHDIDFIDIFGIGGDPDDLDEDPDEEEDKLLAVGRLQTLVLAEGKAVRRSFRYCRRLIRDLRRVIAALPRPAHPDAGGEPTPAS